MKRKDIFFACLLMVCFVVSAVVMAGDYLGKMLERDWNDNRTQHFVDADEQETHSDNASAVESEESNASQMGSETENQQDSQQTETKEDNLQGDQPTVPGGEDATTEHASETESMGEIEDKPLEFQTLGYDYFDDALFIGDSRTVGIMEYGNLENAVFFADSGMSVYGLAWKKISVPDRGKITFDEILEEQQFGKIYLMLGMNELGYRFDTTKERYQETLQKLKEKQPDAIIFLCANMHVTQEQSEKDDIYNNENINLFNEVIASLADGETTFYIDVNELFDDETGSLSTEYTSDAYHVLGKYYVDWVDWLCTKAILLPEKEVQEVENG